MEKTEAQKEITCLRTHSQVTAFSASLFMKGKLSHQKSFCLLSVPQSKVKVMMVVITTPFKSGNEFLKDLNKFWLLNKSVDPSGRYSEEYYCYWGWVFPPAQSLPTMFWWSGSCSSFRGKGACLVDSPLSYVPWEPAGCIHTDIRGGTCKHLLGLRWVLSHMTQASACLDLLTGLGAHQVLSGREWWWENNPIGEALCSNAETHPRHKEVWMSAWLERGGLWWLWSVCDSKENKSSKK